MNYYELLRDHSRTLQGIWLVATAAGRVLPRNLLSAEGTARQACGLQSIRKMLSKMCKLPSREPSW